MAVFRLRLDVEQWLWGARVKWEEMGSVRQSARLIPAGPGSIGHIPIFHETPLDALPALESEVIPGGGADVDASVGIAVWTRGFFAENILPVVGLEGTHILPLGITYHSVGMDRHPMALANRDASAAVVAPEPGNHFRHFRAVAAVGGDIIVGQGDIKRVLRGSECGGKQAVASIRVVVAAVIRQPVLIPGARLVRRRVVLGRKFANPEYGGRDPTVPLCQAAEFFRRIFHHHARGRGHPERITQARQGGPAVFQKTLVGLVETLGESIRKTGTDRSRSH